MSHHHAVSRRVLALAFGAAFACGPALGAGPSRSSATSDEPTVAFVCAHGNVKSLMAAERFNRLAEQRGLKVRAISRAANPETLFTKVPESLAKDMGREGYRVADVQPQALSREEASRAVRLVHISLEGPLDLSKDPDPRFAAPGAVERWNGIPNGLTQFETANRMISARVDELIEQFARKQAALTSN
jgi:arsenate reductase (thioredoxin)